jgi:tripartite-type tricarboxylate transporter receptor subunit TctC
MEREAGMAVAYGFGGRFMIAVSALWAGAFSSPATAQDQAPWGKQMVMYVGSAPGGGYDTFSRVIAAHLGHHLAGQPTVVVQNMPGAGSLVLANHLYNVAPRNGSVIGALNPQVATEPLVRPERVKFDPRRMQWLGSALRETHVAVAWHDSPIKTFDDLFTHELIVAGSGGSTDTFPNFLNALLHTKFKVVSGYKGTKDGMLAMERGEVTGNGGITWASLKATQASWLKEGKVRVILQYGLSKHPELPTVPWIYDYAKSAEDRAAMNLVFARQEFGRPYVAPPEVPAATVAALRKAFDETMSDAAFLADAKKRRLDIEPIGGEEIQKLVNDLYASPPKVIARVKAILEQASER